MKFFMCGIKPVTAYSHPDSVNFRIVWLQAAHEIGVSDLV